jgi:Tfp pilus assembly protein PilO
VIKKPFYVEYNGSYYRVVQFTETVNKLTKIDNVSSVRDNKIEIGFSSSKPNNNKVSEVSTSNTKSSIEGMVI